MRGLKHGHENGIYPDDRVAPSRVRGLKQVITEYGYGQISRTLTGAWIETGADLVLMRDTVRRTLTGAWIETTHASCCR